jgi:2-iminobutanoate/2-iminopropanoate deaminase
MNRQVFNHPSAGAALPFSSVVRAGNTLYVSGHVPIEPETKNITSGGIGPQTRQTLENLKRTLALAGATLDNVVKVNIFLTDMSEFKEMNAIYKEYFPSEPPARTTVGTPALSNPEMRIEIEVIALVD